MELSQNKSKETVNIFNIEQFKKIFDIYGLKVVDIPIVPTDNYQDKTSTDGSKDEEVMINNLDELSNTESILQEDVISNDEDSSKDLEENRCGQYFDEDIENGEKVSLEQQLCSDSPTSSESELDDNYERMSKNDLKVR